MSLFHESKIQREREMKCDFKDKIIYCKYSILLTYISHGLVGMKSPCYVEFCGYTPKYTRGVRRWAIECKMFF